MNDFVIITITRPSNWDDIHDFVLTRYENNKLQSIADKFGKKCYLTMFWNDVDMWCNKTTVKIEYTGTLDETEKQLYLEEIKPLLEDAEQIKFKGIERFNPSYLLIMKQIPASDTIVEIKGDR